VKGHGEKKEEVYEGLVRRGGKIQADDGGGVRWDAMEWARRWQEEKKGKRENNNQVDEKEICTQYRIEPFSCLKRPLVIN